MGSTSNSRPTVATYIDSHTHAYPDRNANTYSYSDSDSDSHTHATANTNTNTYSHSNADANSNSIPPAATVLASSGMRGPPRARSRRKRAT